MSISKFFFVTVIIVSMFILGFIISSDIQNALDENYTKYDSAAKIDSPELFRYGMRSNLGYAFAYGKLETVDPVSYPELSGAYSSIRKEEQEYVEHSKTVQEEYTDADGKSQVKNTVQYYWTWDTIETSTITASKIYFLYTELDYGTIPFPTDDIKVKTINTEYNKRTVYYCVDTSFYGTIFANLGNNTVNSTTFYKNKIISEVVNDLETKSEFATGTFWLCWLLFTFMLTLGFLVIDNRKKLHN